MLILGGGFQMVQSMDINGPINWPLDLQWVYIEYIQRAFNYRECRE